MNATGCAAQSDARERARPELRLLFCAARGALSPADAQQLDACLDADLEWSWLLDAAARHGVWPLLNRHLAATAAARVPPEVRAALREAAEAHAQYARGRVASLHQLLDAFGAAGLDVIPHKGPALAARLYGGSDMRQFSDLDFLVLREQARPAAACLAARGFVPDSTAPSGWQSWYERARYDYSFVHPEDGLAVELQWQPWQRFVGMPVDYRAFWDRRETLPLDGRRVTGLQREALLFLLCLHGTKHQWVRLAWLADVAEILRASPDLAWERVLPLAADSRSECFLFIALRLAQRLMDAPLPEDVARRVRANPRAARLADAMEARLCSGAMRTPGEWEHLRHMLRALPRRRDRVRMLWGVAVEPCRDDWALCPLPPSLVGLYALVRPARLACAGVRRLLERGRTRARPEECGRAA